MSCSVLETQHRTRVILSPAQQDIRSPRRNPLPGKSFDSSRFSWNGKAETRAEAHRRWVTRMFSGYSPPSPAHTLESAFTRPLKSAFARPLPLTCTQLAYNRQKHAQNPHTHTPHKTYTKARMKLTIVPPKICKNTGGFRQLLAPKVWSKCTQTATHIRQHGTQGIPKCHPKTLPSLR